VPNSLPKGVYHGMTLDHALRMDANAIAALLLATLQDRVKRRKLVRLQGPEAQSLLNLLQAVRIFVFVVRPLVTA
jgi:hypothetical protein